MNLRPEIVALLRQGLPDYVIAQRLHTHKTKVAEHRQRLGLPKTPRGRLAAPSLEAAFQARTEPVTGGHVRWTGHVSRAGMPIVRYDGTNHSAYRVAFRIRTGRDPQGPCSSDCGMSGCVAPGHVEDSVGRQRTRKALAALNGQCARLDRCGRGHDLSVHREYSPKGEPYCGACVRQRMSARRGQQSP